MRPTSVFALFALSSVALSETLDPWKEIKCNAQTKCPELRPCCSQFGVCGTGSICLGGCDPRSSFSINACMPQPKMDNINESFKDINIIMKQEEYLGNVSEADWVYSGHIASHDDALMLQMPKNSFASVVSSTKYLLYGKVGASMKAARGKGVVSAFITFSDVHDEIDFEFMGANLTYPQNNYYAKGITNHTNGGSSQTSDMFENWHYYEMDWQEDKIVWSIDGQVVRTLEKKDTFNSTSKKFGFPMTPSRVQFSLWPAGSKDNAPGTVEWAGGAIDWDSPDIKDVGYYYTYVKNVSVISYGLPSYVKLENGTNSKYNAFIYKSADGDEGDFVLTDAKTWLGSKDASGLDPKNKDSDKKSSSSALEVTLTAAPLSVEQSVKSRSSGFKQAKSTKGTTKTTLAPSQNHSFVQGASATSANASLESTRLADSGAQTTRYGGVTGVCVAILTMALGVVFVDL